MKKLIAIALTAATFVGAHSAQAASILVSRAVTSSFDIDTSNYDTFRGFLAPGNTLTYVTDMSNAAQVNAADALFVTTRAFNDTLSAAEVTNITNFINAGKRVYLGGENAGWTTWNNSILGLVGGSQGGAVTGVQTTVLNNALTAGVSTVSVPAASGTATGGTSLFDGNFANLWGATQNVLTVQDLNYFQDNFIGNEDNTRFAQNIAAWLSEDVDPMSPVPLPAGFPLVLTGLAGVWMVGRRRKSQQS